MYGRLHALCQSAQRCSDHVGDRELKSVVNGVKREWSRGAALLAALLPWGLNPSHASNLSGGSTQGALANREVAVVAAGAAHVLVMTTDGELWTWGDNSRSQLGLGKHTVRQTQPTHLQVDTILVRTWNPRAVFESA